MTHVDLFSGIGGFALADCENKIPQKAGKLFDSNYRKNSRILPCGISSVDRFIKAHYLSKRPAIVRLVLAMLHKGQAVGCVVYAEPPRETHIRYGGKTWELARLYIDDEIPFNAETWLIAQSVKYIWRHFPKVENLVSYADPSAGHRGTIYRAANWNFDGMTDENRKTPRCDYVDVRTGKKYGRKGNIPIDAIIERRPRTRKYRFVLRLRRKSLRQS